MTTILKDQEDLATEEREESVSNMFWPMPSSTRQGKEEASLCIMMVMMKEETSLIDGCFIPTQRCLCVGIKLLSMRYWTTIECDWII